MGCVSAMTTDRENFIPEFASDDEEREFWETHDIRDFDDGPATDVFWDLRPETKEPLCIRVQPSVVRMLKAVARRVGMPYQTLTRGLIIHGLREYVKQLDAGDHPAATAGEEDR